MTQSGAGVHWVRMPMARARLLLLLTPPLLLASCYAVFTAAAVLAGDRAGYLIGFLFYWVAWCLLLPMTILGWQGVRRLFRRAEPAFGRPAWVGAAAFGLPLLLGFGYALPRALTGASLLVVALSAGLAVVNGVLEELLWRGAYTAVFPRSRVLGWVYPAFGFGVWHFAPQAVFPNPAPGGNIALVAVAVGLGLLWGWVARTSGSIRWTSFVHVLFNFSGLGARVYFG